MLFANPVTSFRHRKCLTKGKQKKQLFSLGAAHFLVGFSTPCTSAGPVAANVCPDEITCCRLGGGCGGGTREVCLQRGKKKRRENLEHGQVFLPRRLPTRSSCHVAGCMKQVNTEEQQKQQTNHLECVCVCLCSKKHKNRRIHTCVRMLGELS